VTDASDRRTVQVYLGPRSYEVSIVTEQLAATARYIERWRDGRENLRTGPGRALLVTDRNVARPHAATVGRSLADAGWTCRQAVLDPGEPAKRLEMAGRLYDELVELGADRQTIVVAVGGGVIGDLAGFAAATYARGIPFVQIPTTLLAQVDSSVGGKVGVNHPKAKNLIGAFHQPLGVLADTDTLDTLPDRDYRSGLAEVVKYGVILDEEFFAWLEANVEGLNRRDPAVLRNVIARSCRLKADVVEQDEYENTGLRAVLNYGHTFAHAFEALCGYGELLHGEAVAVGMVYASRLAERRGLVDSSLTERQCALLSAVGLPIALPAGPRLKPDDLLGCMRLDKKAVAGRLRFILPARLGEVRLFDDVPEADVRSILEAP
jgi:3-dehydroquinate synthase